MSYFAQGFLSEPLDEVRNAVQIQYADYRRVLLRINEQCMSTQYELHIDVDKPRDLLGGALFSRTLASSQAAILLLEYGLITQARTVLRSALESLFALAAIEAKPELALPLARSQEANKRSIADKALQWQDADLKASLSARIDINNPKIAETNRTRDFGTAELAKAAGMMDWYLSIYALLSFPAHATVSDLVSHLVTDADGNITHLKNEPELEGQESTWAFAIEIQIRAAKAVCGLFAIKTIDIASHENDLRNLIARAAT